MPSAKQQPSNIKHHVGIRPNVCKLTFGPPKKMDDSVLNCFAKHTTIAHDSNNCRPFNYGGLKLIDIREYPTLQPKVIFSRFIAHILTVVNAGNGFEQF